ncbi:SDR family NAD(P)-dependent oxidoreductase [Streptacidiphilus rugosus]|uniref:SDR family NAD(P)-dependent oxidoreductase n=1 Tax=Streptacidiphilus rugosus TaxID=405783 RepID=UPI00056932AE|nr:SDR family oxidoreductase [Streptacidiphilus rugosus]
MHLTGKTVLLTGASGGIGRAIARELHRHHVRLVLTGRRIEALTELAEQLDAQVLAADLSSAAAVEGLAEVAGPVDVFIANAALPSSGDLLGYTPEQIDRALDVNLRAPIMLTRLLVPGMLSRGSGHVVMIGSISGKVASPSVPLYNATKYGLRGFTHGLRQDLHGTGIGVSLVQPGFVRDAGMFADTGATPPAGTRTVAPQQVATAVIEAIQRNRAEVNVAPLEIRLASALGGVFPTLAENVQRKAKAKQLAEQISNAQQHKR